MLLDRSLITRTSLQDVGRLLQFSESKDWDGFRQYSNTCDPVSLVLLDNINAVWDKKKKIKLPKFEPAKVVQNSLIHRWTVLYSIETASSVPQKPAGIAAIAAARAWVVEPSEAAAAAASAAVSASEADAYAYTTAAATYSAAVAAHAAYAAAHADKLEIRVLAAIQDYLPEPV